MIKIFVITVQDRNLDLPRLSQTLEPKYPSNVRQYDIIVIMETKKEPQLAALNKIYIKIKVKSSRKNETGHSFLHEPSCM